MNTLDTAGNVYTKTMAQGNDIVVTSRRSFWFTTFPPPGIIQSVLNTGIYQRVLTYARYIDTDFRKRISKKRAKGWFQKANIEEPKAELIARFIEIKQFFNDNMLDALSMTQEVFDAMPIEPNNNPDDSPIETQAEAMLRVAFGIMEPDAGWSQAIELTIDSNYEYVDGIRDEIKGVATSFISNIENYTVIFSVLNAAMDLRTNVTPLDVRNAHRTIFPVFEQLVDWLNDEMRLEKSAKRRIITLNRWIACYSELDKHNIPGLDGEVVAKTALIQAYMKLAQVSQGSAYKHWEIDAGTRFDEFKAPRGKAKYVRLRSARRGES
jgi:hypothetical protein